MTMPQTSTAQKPIQKQDRMLKAIWAGSKTFFISVAKTLYAFWLQATGLIWVMFTIMGSWNLIKHYRKDHFADPKRIWIVGAFTVASAFFVVVSFRRAARVQKRGPSKPK